MQLMEWEATMHGHDAKGRWQLGQSLWVIEERCSRLLQIIRYAQLDT
jgi:hypothetical protein